MKVTLKDIAREVGVSVNTVSHALADKPDISEATKEVVRQKAKELGYIRNNSASYMRSGYSHTVAVIVGDISNPHFNAIVREAESYLSRFGYTVMIFNSDENEEKERIAIFSAVSKNVDGIIICPCQRSCANIIFMQQLGVPFTLIGRSFKNIETNCSVCDDVNGGYIAAKHLIEYGHRKILFINGEEYISSAKDRLEGFKTALAQYSVEFNPENVLNVSVKIGGNDEEIISFLNTHDDYTAIFAFSDIIAWNIICLLRKREKKVPRDYSIIGFDDIRSHFRFPIELTSVNSSTRDMAVKAVELLIKNITNKDMPCEKIVLPAILVKRTSTARLI